MSIALPDMAPGDMPVSGIRFRRPHIRLPKPHRLIANNSSIAQGPSKKKECTAISVGGAFFSLSGHSSYFLTQKLHIIPHTSQPETALKPL